MSITLCRRRLETRDWDHTLVFTMFTEGIWIETEVESFFFYTMKKEIVPQSEEIMQVSRHWISLSEPEAAAGGRSHPPLLIVLINLIYEVVDTFSRCSRWGLRTCKSPPPPVHLGFLPSNMDVLCSQHSSPCNWSLGYDLHNYKLNIKKVALSDFVIRRKKTRNGSQCRWNIKDEMLLCVQADVWVSRENCQPDGSRSDRQEEKRCTSWDERWPVSSQRLQFEAPGWRGLLRLWIERSRRSQHVFIMYFYLHILKMEAAETGLC